MIQAPIGGRSSSDGSRIPLRARRWREALVVGIRRDPKEVAPFLTLDEDALDELEVVAFQRFELVAEVPDGDER